MIRSSGCGTTRHSLSGLGRRTRLFVPGVFTNREVFQTIYGSLARGEERAESDIDLMLLGNVSTMKLSPKLRAVEVAVGRQINPTVFSLGEFAKKVTEKNHFVRTVLGNKKIMLVGSQDELEELARREKSPHAQVEQTGTR